MVEVDLEVSTIWYRFVQIGAEIDNLRLEFNTFSMKVLFGILVFGIFFV